MSYNISSVNTMALDAWMSAKDLKRLAKHEDQLAESNFIEDHVDREPDADGNVKLRNFWWCGEGSGRTHDFLVEKVAPKVRGRVEAIFTWEGGDSHSGLMIEDGKVVDCDLEMRLVRRG